jgi:nitrogen regulatory protein PII
MSVIESTDIRIYLSGGATNTNPNASLGGAISSTEMVDNNLHNLFAKVNAAEALTGSTKYRAVYVKNQNGHGLDYQDIVAYIASQTTSDDTSIEIAVSTEAKNTTIQTIANENTAPTGQTSWVSAEGISNGQSMGTLGDGEYRGLWIKRIVEENATAYGSDSATFGTQGETTST